MTRFILAYCMTLVFAINVFAQDAPKAAPAAAGQPADTEKQPKNVIPTISSNKIVDVGTETPKITPVPGGLCFEWQSLNNIGAIEVDKKLAGNFQIMFDAPISSVGKPPEPVSNPEMIVPLADYWIVRGKPERSIPLYRKGLELQPDSLLFQNNLAMLLSTISGQHAEALGIINKALESKADNVTLLDSKGLILMNNGQANEAVPVLEKAVQLSCQFPLYCLHLATALDMDGRETGAKRYFAQAKAQLESQVPKMGDDNKKMFDKLNLKYPNVTGSDASRQ
ncbi:hypothetical protein FACS1894170_04230 [Planctomycetales bacterium]|nr:hypothetical protein FACS1894170_04230 [Planctomycetales bacterium]